jgi:hypothetical protein
MLQQPFSVLGEGALIPGRIVEVEVQEPLEGSLHSGRDAAGVEGFAQELATAAQA